MYSTETHLTDWKNVVDYVSHREQGRGSSSSRQMASEILVSTRSMKPLIAATPSSCRSTYLLRLNPTNELLAAAHGDRSIAVYCASSGSLLGKCVGHERSPWTLTFHPSQPHLLASGCLGGNIRLWNLEGLVKADEMAQSNVLTLSCTKVWKHTGAIASLAFHPTHPILVAAWSQEVVFYDWVSGRKLSVWRFVSNHSRVRWVRFSPDGALLYTATANPSTAQHQLTSASSSDEQVLNTHSSSGVSTTTTHSDCSKRERVFTPVNNTGISRDALLEFLVSRPDAWFHQLGVCSTCSVRLCRWASSLGPEFPPSKIDNHRGTAIVALVAQSVASSMRLTGSPLSYVVKELLPPDISEPLSEVAQRLLSDANPAAVAIIEDVPVQEFLLSRGNYCSTPSNVIGDGGLCCGGHACDLVLAHRDLMRYSICRTCLTAFWRWASRHVSWWRWSNQGIDTTPLPRTSEHVPFPSRSSWSKIASDVNDPRINQRSTPTPDHPKGSPTETRDVNVCSQPTVGICIRCRAGMNSQTKGNECDVTVDALTKPPCSQQPCDSSQRSIPVAALELLQSRLSNANDVTQVTYMASELVAEGALSKRISDLLRSDLLSSGLVKPVPEAFLQLLRQRVTLGNGIVPAGSPLPKRRRISCKDEMFHGAGTSTNYPAGTDDLDDQTDSSSTTNPCHPDAGLAEQAAHFGQLMLAACTDQAWNKPHCVQVHHKHLTSTDPSQLHLELFSYVPTGSRLLRPTVATKAYPNCVNLYSATRSSASPSSGTLARNESEESLRGLEHPVDVDGINGHSMTACCRCGHIVPQTFPIDPQSSLSAVVCEKLVLSEDRYNLTGALGDHPTQCHLNMARESSSSSESAESVRPPISTENSVQSGDPTTRISTAQANGQSTQSAIAPTDHTPSSQSENGNVFYLINRTNTDSVLHAVNRSITEVIAGLFVNMGEHGSANCLQETTYRVCRWELNLCGPIQADCLRCSPRKSDPGSPPDVLSVPRSFLPMPANVAVSYNSNSLVIPHARLFNDSSICLSPDGRMLAAFVAPRSGSRASSSLRELENHTHKQTGFASESTLDTMLAVYRLQPRSRRGQCLFARQFTTCTPVCLDFSPLSEFLAVGMATSRLPSAALPSASFRRLTAGGLLLDTTTPVSRDELLGADGANNATGHAPAYTTGQVVPMRHAFIAKIFHLERKLRSIGNRNNTNCVVRRLHETASVQHPCLLNPVSSSFALDREPRDRWHRLLLSSPNGISLNTIVWNPHGGLFYGTTKGLVVLMQSQPYESRSHASLDRDVPSMLSASDREKRQTEHDLENILDDHARAKHPTSANPSTTHSAWSTTATRFVHFSLPDSSSF